MMQERLSERPSKLHSVYLSPKGGSYTDLRYHCEIKPLPVEVFWCPKVFWSLLTWDIIVLLKAYLVIFSLYNQNFNLEINTQLVSLTWRFSHFSKLLDTFSPVADEEELIIDDSANCKDLN